MDGLMITPEQRDRIEEIKQAIREARGPIERIAAYNPSPSEIGLSVVALFELRQEYENEVEVR